MEFNIQYDRLEVYGVNVFQIQGGFPAFTIYCRPMGVTRYNRYIETQTSEAHLAPSLECIDVQVFVDDEEVDLLNIAEVEEYWGDGICTNACLLTVGVPKHTTDKPYRLFRIRIKDIETGDRGRGGLFL